MLPHLPNIEAIASKLPPWIVEVLPEAFRPVPIKPATFWDKLTGGGIWLQALLALSFIFAFTMIWSRYGLSLPAVVNRAFAFLATRQSNSSIASLRQGLLASKAIASKTQDADKKSSPSQTTDSEQILCDYFGFKAVKSKVPQAKLAPSTEPSLPNIGPLAESLLRAAPLASRSIPLWKPATKSNHTWYSASLALPAPLLRHMLANHQGLPAPFINVARLGLSYYRICRRRQAEAQTHHQHSIASAGKIDERNDVFDQSLQALWAVSLCTESYSRRGEQWKRLGCATDDLTAELRDGGVYALEDLTWFAKTYPAAHREMLLFTSQKPKAETASGNLNRDALYSDLADQFSEATASFLISVMLTRIPSAFIDKEDEAPLGDSDHLVPPSPQSDSGGEELSPLLKSASSRNDSKEMPSFAPTHRDGSCLQFTPTMIRYLYGGAGSVSMFASCPTNNTPRDKISIKPTGIDEKTIRFRLKQLHSCYLRAYFDLWRREKPLSQELFLLKTFYAESGMIVDGYLRRATS